MRFDLRDLRLRRRGAPAIRLAAPLPRERERREDDDRENSCAALRDPRSHRRGNPTEPAPLSRERLVSIVSLANSKPLFAIAREIA
jgi:hypothetical protein